MTQINVQPTPNPNALKFILDSNVKNSGKSSFKNPAEAKNIPLVAAIFDLRGVDQVHIFENVVTVIKFTFEPWESLEPAVQTTIENMIEDHDPDFNGQSNGAKVLLNVQPTPNPNALKFILERDVKTTGKSSFKNPAQAKGVPMAQALFDLRGVDQIHFFQNVITVSKFTFEPWESLEPTVLSTIENMIEDHKPDFKDHDPEVERRKHLTGDLLEIEQILDKKIRPGLQGDGGDLKVLSYNDNVLLIQYVGACGTCPSSTTGTLEAIRAILQEDYSEEIEVYIAPED